MNTLFDRIWDAHVVRQLGDGTVQLYIDRLYCHEVTSPQAFDGLRARGIGCMRPGKVFCMPDHNIPTLGQERPVGDPVSRAQLDALERNAREFGLEYFGDSFDPSELFYEEFTARPYWGKVILSDNQGEYVVYPAGNRWNDMYTDYNVQVLGSRRYRIVCDSADDDSRVYWKSVIMMRTTSCMWKFSTLYTRKISKGKALLWR